MNVGIPVYGNGTTSINTAYVEYVAAAGYEPIIITDHNNVEALVDFCDALMLPGGGDIDPIHYLDNNISSYNTDPYKDSFERGCLQTFIEAEKPIFGICRGFQLIAREFILPCDKLIYYQHISGHSQTGDNKTARYNPSHFVSADTNRLYNTNNNNAVNHIAVNSMHHQGVVLKQKSGIKVGDSIEVGDIKVFITALTNHNAPQHSSGIVEAFNIPDMKITAVQWHPEELTDIELLEAAFGG